MQIDIALYPNFKPFLFTTTFPAPLSAFPSPEWLVALLNLDAVAPVARSEEIRTAIRDLLRHKGYKPTGRGKPASEYLVKAADSGKLGTINAPVDACNVVSLHSGLPISVIDLDKVTSPFSIKPGAQESTYIFNQSGQEIGVAGLLCLHDGQGPCANAVKDSQRTKTSDATTNTLSVIWGLASREDHVESSLTWYTQLLDRMGAATRMISF